MANPRLPKSRLNASAGTGPRGALLDRPVESKRWEVGTVIAYSPQSGTYTINSGTAGAIPEVRRLVQDPGEVGVLPNNTEIVFHYELGFPAIAAVLKSRSINAVEVNPLQVSSVRGVGGESGVYDAKDGAVNVRAPNDPVDVIPDDWIRKGQHNNFIGVLAGGTNVMSSSPMAQIRTHGVSGLVEVMAHAYRHISSMGNMEIKNDEGKTSLTWRAGADQLTENGANAENWTLRLDAGATGDLFRLSVTTPNNNTLCEVHLSADGRLSLTGVAGVDISSGTRGTAVEQVAENKTVEVLGSMSTAVTGPVINILNSSRDTVVATDDSIATGNDLKETVGHDRLTHIANKLRTLVGGAGNTAPAGDVAILWDAVSGGIESVTGNPKNNASPAQKQSQNFVNYVGDFNFAVPRGGKFNIVSSDNDSVILGAGGSATPGEGGHTFNVATAPYHVCRFEKLEELIKELLQWCDTHTHLSAMGPTGPASGAPTGPASAKVEPKIPPVKSTRVLVGS